LEKEGGGCIYIIISLNKRVDLEGEENLVGIGGKGNGGGRGKGTAFTVVYNFPLKRKGVGGNGVNMGGRGNGAALTVANNFL
jgi:hypothetical protein